MRFLINYRRQIIFFLIGIQIGYWLLLIPSIKVDNKINPVELSNVILTLIIALLVSTIIQPVAENTRAEKDLLIEQLKTIKETAKNIHDTFDKHYLSGVAWNPDQRIRFLSLLRFFANQISMFNDFAKYCNSQLLQSHDIKGLYFEYKRCTTNSFTDTPRVSYENYRKSEKAYLKFSNEVNHFIVDINKS